MTIAQAPTQITEKDVLAKLQELLSYGYGRLEIVVRNHQISALNWQKSMVRENTDK